MAKGSNYCESNDWLALCFQLMEALRYLHNEALILHNDIKANNALISERSELPQGPSCASRADHLNFVLIDFGKASTVDQGKKYCLSWIEKTEYTRKYPHLAPELIEGITKQTKKTFFSVGAIIQRIVDYNLFSQLPLSSRSTIATFATNYRSPNFCSRPSASMALETFKQLLH